MKNVACCSPLDCLQVTCFVVVVVVVYSVEAIEDCSSPSGCEPYCLWVTLLEAE